MEEIDYPKGPNPSDLYSKDEQVSTMLKQLEELIKAPCQEKEDCDHCETVKLLTCVEYDLEYAKTHDTPPICVYCKFIEASRSYWSYSLKNDKPEFLCDACYEDHNEPGESNE